MTTRLRKHLRQVGCVSFWTDHEIKAGAVWDEQIRSALERADVIILCVTADFFWSGYIQSVELQHAKERHEAGTALIVPVILKDVLWQSDGFLASLMAVPKDGKPVQTWNPRDTGYADAARRIDEAIKARELVA